MFGCIMWYMCVAGAYIGTREEGGRMAGLLRWLTHLHLPNHQYLPLHTIYSLYMWSIHMIYSYDIFAHTKYNINDINLKPIFLIKSFQALLSKCSEADYLSARGGTVQNCETSVRQSMRHLQFLLINISPLMSQLPLDCVHHPPFSVHILS